MCFSMRLEANIFFSTKSYLLFSLSLSFSLHTLLTKYKHEYERKRMIRIHKKRLPFIFHFIQRHIIIYLLFRTVKFSSLNWFQSYIYSKLKNGYNLVRIYGMDEINIHKFHMMNGRCMHCNYKSLPLMFFYLERLKVLNTNEDVYVNSRRMQRWIKR